MLEIQHKLRRIILFWLNLMVRVILFLDLEFSPPRLFSSGSDKVIDTADDVIHMPN